MSTPRYVARFMHVESDTWEDAAFFKSSDIERAERFVINMVGANQNVQRGQLVDQISELVRLEIAKEQLTHTVECLDDNSLRMHFTNVEAASAYANELLANNHKAQLLPYQPEQLR